jgi:methylated-DNA-[protein]-cysteine S-methyltransferase
MISQPNSKKTYLRQVAPTPLGLIWIAHNQRGLVALALDTSREAFTSAWGDDPEIISGETTELGEEAERQLRDYLAGELKSFDLPIDWSLMTPFQEQALRATYAIPYGETRSYGEIATIIGKPGAARAVGRAQATNPIPLVIPCHRVIGADGSLHGYGGGLDRKAWLLTLERAEG